MFNQQNYCQVNCSVCFDAYKNDIDEDTKKGECCLVCDRILCGEDDCGVRLVSVQSE